MKKLLIVNTSCNTGSTGRIAEEIGQTAIANGYECYFAYSIAGRESKCKTIQIGNSLDFKLHALSTRLFDNHGFCSTSATKALIKKIEEIKPDVINLHNIHGYYLNIEVLFKYLAKTNIPVVWTLHDCWPFTGHCAHYMRIKCDKWKTQCDHCLNRGGYPRSLFLDCSSDNFSRKKKLFTAIKNLTIVTPCHWLESDVKRSFFGTYSVRAIYNGTDTEVFKPVNSDALRDQYQIKPDDKVLLGVASVWSPIKGLADFFKLRSQLDNSYKIFLVGLNSKQIASLPDGIIGIQRTESVKQLAEFYSMADVFVNPTYVDNFPTTNIEALACGTPVITYNTGGSPEAIDSNTGLVVKQGDLIQLQNYIKYIAERKNEYSDKCRQRAVKLFNKQNRFNEYVELFNTVIYE